MANSDHLARLRRGIGSWNSWRRKNPVTPDLTQANFCGADFSDADFSQANLCGANLSRTNLSRANFSEADISEANLSSANLSKAKLGKASLRRANLSKADLNQAILGKANLVGADLSQARLNFAALIRADISEANLSDAELVQANLRLAKLRHARANRANLNGANLVNADLSQADLAAATFISANLSQTNLADADLSGADLTKAVLVGTVLKNANITGCHIYGLSAWDVDLSGTMQSNLVITPADASIVTVDSLEVAQFIYLLLNNQKIRHVIDTITSKVVLILGRFTPERKAILDAIRDELRKQDYLPVLFDFEKPASRDITETVSTLAHMAKFVIADITDAKSIPQKLMAIVPTLPSVPVQPLLLVSQREYGMFEHFKRFPWVLEPYLYEDQDGLLAAIPDKVIGPAEAKAKEQTGK